MSWRFCCNKKVDKVKEDLTLTAEEKILLNKRFNKEIHITWKTDHIYDRHTDIIIDFKPNIPIDAKLLTSYIERTLGMNHVCSYEDTTINCSDTVNWVVLFDVGVNDVDRIMKEFNEALRELKNSKMIAQYYAQEKKNNEFLKTTKGRMNIKW